MYIVHGTTWWLQIYRIVRNLHPIINSETVGAWDTYVLRYGVYRTGNDFELIPTMKIETRHPIEIYFGREFPAVIIAELWQPEVARIGKFSRTFCVFLEKRPLMIKFSKFCSEGLHRDTDRRCCVQNWWKSSNGKSVKACIIYLTKKHFFGSLSNCGYCADRAQSLPWPAPNIWLTTSQISSKLVHFQRSYSRPREGCSKCAIKYLQVLGKA